MWRRTLVLILLFCCLITSAFAYIKEESDFQKNFNIAKQHLSQRRISKALPYLLYLNKTYPRNANLKYLIGVCYAEEEIVNPKTLELLNEASLKASLEYDPNSLEEERVPIYVFYYLSISYSQNKMCDKAEKARNKFLEIYPHDDKYYIEESLRWLKVCRKMTERPKEKPLPSFPDFEPYSSEKEEIIEQEPEVVIPRQGEQTIVDDSPKKIVTKRIEYSTVHPLYGVQLGAFKEVVPVSRFKAMKNIDVFMDKKGLIRYVVGHFSINSQAESLLEYIKGQGYEDAFVVNVNDHKKFADEVVSVNNVNIRASSKVKIEYRVQIGAFKESIPDKDASMYLKIDGIKEHHEDDLTYLMVGKFKTYIEAKAYSQGIIDAGISDAFVIALTNGKKISLQHAIDLKNKL